MAYIMQGHGLTDGQTDKRTDRQPWPPHKTLHN